MGDSKTSFVDCIPSEIINADSGGGCRVRDGRSKVSAVNAATAAETIGVRLGLHLVVELLQVEYLKHNGLAMVLLKFELIYLV
jgi:hypothetical protein